MEARRPPAPPSQGNKRRQRRPAITSPPTTAQFDPPLFRIGGKTDPGRFVSQYQQQFFILGFHDEERLDIDDNDPEDEEEEEEEAFGRPSGPQPHPLRISLGNLMRTTLSPVKEEQVRSPFTTSSIPPSLSLP